MTIHDWVAITGTALVTSGTLIFLSIQEELRKVIRQRKTPNRYSVACYTCGQYGVLAIGKNRVSVSPCACVKEA